LDYVIWRANPVAGFCGLGPLQNVDDAFELKRGISREQGFPQNAEFHMDPAHPTSVKLGDNLYTLENVLVISKPLQEFLASREPLETEFLPVSIINHKGRVASPDYFIVNPLSVQDCIDQGQSKIEYNPIEKDLISVCEQLVLDDQRIDARYILFRPRFMPTVVLLRRDVADDALDAGFKGMRHTDIDEFEL
jgi:hypothetical protein